MTPRTSSESAAMLTDVTLSQIPELSEFAEDNEDNDADNNLLADDSEFDLLRRDYEQGHATSFASDHGQPTPRPRKSSTRGIFKAKTNKSDHATKLRPPSTAKPFMHNEGTTDLPSKSTRAVRKITRESAEPEHDHNAENVLLQDILRPVRATKRAQQSQSAVDVHAYKSEPTVKHTSEPGHTKIDLDTRRIQSTQTQIPRVRVGADTNTKDCAVPESESQHEIGGKLISYSQRLATFPKTTFSTKSTISDEPPSTHRSNIPTPKATYLTTVTRPHETEILPVHRSNTSPTPEPAKLTTTGLHETSIPPVPAAPMHTPTLAHPDPPSSQSPPPEQPPQASTDHVIEDDEQEELEVADITISIAESDADEDLESTTSKLPNNTIVESNSIPTRYLEREHVQAVFSPMRRSTKRSIDGNQETADEGNGEEDSEDDEDEHVYGQTGMEDSDAEVETDLHMGVDLGTEKDGTEGGGGHTCMAECGSKSTHETKHGKKVPPQKKVKISESISVKALPAKRTKYIPRSATTSATSISSATTSTSKATTAMKAGIRSGAGGGKAVGAPHLTQLRETHRRLGIAKSERAVVSRASGSSIGRTGTSTTGGRVGIRPTSRSVSASLDQRHTKSIVGREAGPSSMLTKEREKEPWVNVWTTDATDSGTSSSTTRMGGTKPAAATHLTKPVPFTFRVDARVRRVVTDHCISGPSSGGAGGAGGGAGEKDKGKKIGDDGLKKLFLLESDRGESQLRRQQMECAPPSSGTGTSASSISSNPTTRPTTFANTATSTSTSTTVPHPFTFTTALRATERAKFDTVIRQKQEEMARAREEARERAEEEMEREVREMRRRAVPKAHEVPEWYKDLPKRGAGMRRG